MSLSETFRLDDYVAPWTPTAMENRKAIADGWKIAHDFTNLHLQALESISRSAGRQPSDQHQALILIGGHAFNLYVAILRLIVHGQFDIASYLVRGLIDSQGLVYAIIRVPEFATKFFKDELKASDARKFVINDLRNSGEDETADFMNSRWSAEAKAANSLAHTCAVHADKLIQTNNGSLTPVLCGRVDQRESALMCVGAHEYEHWLLAWYHAFHLSILPGDWVSRFGAAQKVFSSWAKKVAGPVQ